MRFLLFDIYDRDSGRTYRIWSDGDLEGFGANTVMSNHALPLLQAFMGNLAQISRLAQEVVARADRAQALQFDPSMTGEGTEPFRGLLPQLATGPAKSRG